MTLPLALKDFSKNHYKELREEILNLSTTFWEWMNENSEYSYDSTVNAFYNICDGRDDSINQKKYDSFRMIFSDSIFTVEGIGRNRMCFTIPGSDWVIKIPTTSCGVKNNEEEKASKSRLAVKVFDSISVYSMDSIFEKPYLVNIYKKVTVYKELWNPEAGELPKEIESFSVDILTKVKRRIKSICTRFSDCHNMNIGFVDHMPFIIDYH
jgi:hypothetical protein